MKMIIEVSGGCITSITATQECSIYLVDHDNLRERAEGDGKAIEEAREVTALYTN